MKTINFKKKRIQFLTKRREKTKRKRSKFSMVLFLALILDGTLSFTSIYSQIEDKKKSKLFQT